MRAYELMIIFDGDLDEEAVSASLGKVTTNIESEGGRIASVQDSEPWGRRRFAYRINHKWEGFYVVLDVVPERAASIRPTASSDSRTAVRWSATRSSACQTPRPPGVDSSATLCRLRPADHWRDRYGI